MREISSWCYKNPRKANTALPGPDAVAVVWSGHAGGLSSPRSCKWREAEALRVIKKVNWISLGGVLNMEAKGQLHGWGPFPGVGNSAGGRRGL